jgi:hypothetical protein
LVPNRNKKVTPLLSSLIVWRAIISPLAFSSISASQKSPFHNNSLCACQSSPRETKRQVCQQQWLRQRVIYVDCCWCSLAGESHLANNDNGPLHPPAEQRALLQKAAASQRERERLLLREWRPGQSAAQHFSLHGARCGGGARRQSRGFYEVITCKWSAHVNDMGRCERGLMHLTQLGPSAR